MPNSIIQNYCNRRLSSKFKKYYSAKPATRLAFFVSSNQNADNLHWLILKETGLVKLWNLHSLQITELQLV